MLITLYNFSKRENSTKKPDDEGVSIECYLKENTSIYTPSFILNTSDISYNYVKWDSRYYYVNEVSSLENNVWIFECEIDVLATWKDEIENTSAFVKYSTSKYDIDIPDLRISADKDSIINKKTSKIFETGEYYVGFFAVPPGFGSGVKCFDSYTEYYKATSCLNTRDFLTKTIVDVGDYISKAYNNVTDCFFGSFLLPIKPNFLTGAIPLSIGLNYDTKSVAHDLDTFSTFNTEIEIPWNFNDFRNRSQYTSVLLYLPGCGITQLNTDDLLGHSRLEIDCVMCNYNGDITYIVKTGTNIIFTSKCNVATQLFVTSQTGNFGNAISSVAQGVVGSVISGNPLSAISGSFNAVFSSMQSNVGTFGGGGGVSTISINSNVEIITISHNTLIEPSSISTLQGRPFNQITTIESLSGYVECSNASVDCNAPVNLKDKINAFMNGGFYNE